MFRHLPHAHAALGSFGQTLFRTVSIILSSISTYLSISFYILYLFLLCFFLCQSVILQRASKEINTKRSHFLSTTACDPFRTGFKFRDCPRPASHLIRARTAPLQLNSTHTTTNTLTFYAGSMQWHGWHLEVPRTLTARTADRTQ